MNLIQENSDLWEYMSEDLRDLVMDGQRLYNLIILSKEDSELSDYSFLVFPFAKCYEGFLKQFFLDIGYVSEDEYFSDDMRIGRILNPSYIKEKSSLYRPLTEGGHTNLASRMWKLWKRGRNLVFHYFPHNYRKLSFTEAEEIIHEFIKLMYELSVKGLDIVE